MYYAFVGIDSFLGTTSPHITALNFHNISVQFNYRSRPSADVLTGFDRFRVNKIQIKNRYIRKRIQPNRIPDRFRNPTYTDPFFLLIESDRFCHRAIYITCEYPRILRQPSMGYPTNFNLSILRTVHNPKFQQRHLESSLIVSHPVTGVCIHFAASRYVNWKFFRTIVMASISGSDV